MGAPHPRAAILIIEDDVVIRRMLAEVLAEEGDFAVTAVDFDEMPPGPQAYSVVMTDLPSRHYVATRAKQWVRSLHERYPATPIVVCTAYREAFGEPDRLGADGLVPKPFDIPYLIDVIDLVADDALASRSAGGMRSDLAPTASTRSHAPIR
jgi:CheY-like chemotaxis protein